MTGNSSGAARDGVAAGTSAAGCNRVKQAVPVTVTYLEMTSPAQRSPGPGWSEPTQVLRAERPTTSFYRYLYGTVGADWDWWTRRQLSDEALAAIIHDESVEVFVLYVRGVPAGFVELDRRIEEEVEIAYFGLIPEYIGRRLGPALLDWTLARAWSYGPRRVWLHTCSLDHPKALAVYRRAGLEVYDRQVVSVETELIEIARRGPTHGSTEDRSSG